MSPLLQNELFSKWSSASISARHKLLAIGRQEGIEEVKRKGIIIDREVSLGTYLKFCEGEPRIDQLRVIGEVDVIVDTRSVYRSDISSLHVSTQNYLQRTVNVPANTITGVGFGAGPCNDANIQDYQIPIPTILFFNGVPGDISAGVPNNFNIDLWKLQDVNLNS
nr:6144_t:CDS:2 [Entrophospora candida]